MAPMKDETRLAVRHLYFVEQLSPDDIARCLRLSRRAVRRALVIRGGVRSERPAGPYRKKESDS